MKLTSQIFQSCNNGAGICIPYYYCINGTVDPEAYQVLSIRLEDSSDCANYFEKCCAEESVIPGVIAPIAPVEPNETSEYELRPCGFRNEDGQVFRISGGPDGETEFGEFSWMVQLLLAEEILGERISLYHCGGSIIHSSVVLSGKS